MAPGALKECHIVVLNANGYRDDYTMPNLRKWVENSGGHISFKPKLTEQTTHVVIDEDTWLEQGPFIQEIFQAETKDTDEQKGRKIHIVSFDWLQECLDARVKKGESSFKWKNLAGKATKDAERSKKLAKQLDADEKTPGNTQGLMAQAFLDSTEAYIDPSQRRKIEKRKRQDAIDREEDQQEEKRLFDIHRKKMSIPEQAAVFKKGAKRARNDILSDNHHIYMDSTGFPLDVTVTKIDYRNNVNERYALTIYETNTEPHTYAFNCQFGGTKALARNDIIAAIGSNFPTAFRAFKKVFKEKTGVEWDNRIVEYNRRKANDKLAGDTDEVEFKKLPFEYFPPEYGPVGELPREQEEATAGVQKAPAVRPPEVVSGLEVGEEAFDYPFERKGGLVGEGEDESGDVGEGDSGGGVADEAMDESLI